VLPLRCGCNVIGGVSAAAASHGHHAACRGRAQQRANDDTTDSYGRKPCLHHNHNFRLAVE